jgi:ketosteroid isomerase-like protein
MSQANAKGAWRESKRPTNIVIASVRFQGEGRSSRARVPMHVHMVGTFRDGKLVRRQVFLTLAKALEAAGLRE